MSDKNEPKPQTTSDPAVGSSALLAHVTESQTPNAGEPVSIGEAAISALRRLYPKMSDLLRDSACPVMCHHWGQMYQSVGRYKELLDQWKEDGSPELEWPSEAQVVAICKSRQ